MDRKELEIIQELMDVLQDKMQYGEDDLSDRLGRKKPGLEVVKVEGSMPMTGKDPLEHAEGMAGADMGEDQDSMGMDEDPDDKLKRRLMSMRG